MGILNNLAKDGLKALGVSTERTVRSTLSDPDFPEGLEIVEYVNGRLLTKEKIQLVGSFGIHDSFDFGGTQRLKKEYYAGSTEPTVQVLGPSEDDITVKGEFKTFKFKDGSLRQAAEEYQELVDAMRLRGNLVRITLGEWRRYGFIEKVKFGLKKLTNITYEIQFNIVGFNPPKGYLILDERDDDLISPNKKITDAAFLALDAAQNRPITVPQDIGDLINGVINDVAGVVNNVTSFVDGIITDANQLNKGLNRALGMIKYARSFIASRARQIGSISHSFSNMGSSFASEADKTAATIINIRYLNQNINNLYNLSALLAAMRVKFAALAKTVPLVRHKITQNDTLQSLAMKYYQNSDLWKKIYDHNKLQTTNLTLGNVLEIPKL